MTEQFHLSRLQVINWGVFDGYHSIPFSSGGALIAGASGSGKSSLLDAISLGFLPFNRRNFNASGDNTAAGSSAGRRTVDKYVRGAWGQRSDGGTSRVMYLRGDGTAWSAVAVTYASDYRPHRHRPGAQMAHRRIPQRLVEPVRPRRRRPRHRGRLQPLGRRPLRRRRLQGRDWRFSTKVESQYLAQLYATIGIRASDAAQQLLGKAKSLKSVGGLEQFVREFMLDEPDSLARLPEALKQIDPLVEARELLAVAQKKRKILGDIETDPAALRLGVLGPRHHRPRRRADGAGLHRPRPARAVPGADRDARRHHRPARERVRGRHPSAESGQGRSGFAQRADQRLQREHRPAAVAGDRRRDRGRGGGAPARRLRGPAHRPGRRRSPTPPTSSGTCARNCSTQATELLAKVERDREASTDAEYAQKSARIARDDAAKELKRVEHVGSALPEFATHDARTHLRRSRCRRRRAALHRRTAGPASPTRPAGALAVEKVLRGAGLRLLVPDQHCAAVLRFVNETNMRGRLQLHHVRAKLLGAEPVEPEPNTLAGKLFAVDPTHPCAAEAVDVIAARRRPRLRRHPRRVRPVPPRGHRHRPVQGLRPAGHQGRPAPGQAVRVPLPGRRRRQDQRADRRTGRRRGGLPDGPPRRRRHRRRSASSGATGPRRARRSASSSRSGARSTPRPPTGTPTGCASSTSC